MEAFSAKCFLADFSTPLAPIDLGVFALDLYDHGAGCERSSCCSAAHCYRRVGLCECAIYTELCPSFTNATPYPQLSFCSGAPPPGYTLHGAAQTHQSSTAVPREQHQEQQEQQQNKKQQQQQHS